MKQRLLCVLLAMLLCIGTMPVALAAEEDWMTSGDFQYELNSDGSANIMGYVGEGGDITIPATLDGHPVKNLGMGYDGAFDIFKDDARITSVTIEEGIETIATMMFMNCTNLTEVSLPSTLTTIGLNAFLNTGLTNLDGFAKANQVTALMLSGCANLSDVDGLAGMTGLEDLRVQNCPKISDISGVSGLTNLETLHFYECNISDLRPLSGLANLKWLGLNGNVISDLSPISGLTGLRQLNAEDNQITDLSSLAGMTGMDSLMLSGNQIKDVAPLAGMTKLRMLWLDDNGLTDISPLATLTALERLYLSDNAVTDISAVANMAQLGTFEANNNAALSNIDPLMGLDNLTMVSLTGTQVSGADALRLTRFDNLTTEAGEAGTRLEATLPVTVRYGNYDYVSQTATFTSSDPDIAASVSGGASRLYYELGGNEGTATITASLDGVSKTFTITVGDIYELGDIDGNGKEYPDNAINANDALLALRHSVKEINLADDAAMAKLDIPAGALKRANVTAAKDPKEPLTQVDASDALQILRYSVKEIDSFYA